MVPFILTPSRQCCGAQSSVVFLIAAVSNPELSLTALSLWSLLTGEVSDEAKSRHGKFSGTEVRSNLSRLHRYSRTK